MDRWLPLRLGCLNLGSKVALMNSDCNHWML